MNELPPLRDVIASHGLGAKKAFGQHFLFDLNLTAKIARLAGDLDGLVAVEIGPGPGGLTRALLATQADHVIAIEKDPRFLPVLLEAGTHYGDRLTLIEADALDADEHALTAGKPAIIASNLPYNVGTPLLVGWLSAAWTPLPWWSSLTLMFQMEVAERIVAKPDTDHYGRLAVLSQWRSDARIAMKVHRSAFTPPPKVMSAVVHITPKPTPEGVQLKLLERLTAAAFGQRRKMMRQSLKGLPGALDALDAEGIDPQRRAETVSVEEFVAIARRMGRN